MKTWMENPNLLLGQRVKRVKSHVAKILKKTPSSILSVPCLKYDIAFPISGSIHINLHIPGKPPSGPISPPSVIETPPPRHRAMAAWCGSDGGSMQYGVNLDPMHIYSKFLYKFAS